ncbi:unnamed protein product [Sphagnum balticum]
MSEIMVREAQSCDLKELVAKFIPEAHEDYSEEIGAKIELPVGDAEMDAEPVEAYEDYSEEIGAKIELPVGDAEMDAEPVEVPGA